MNTKLSHHTNLQDYPSKGTTAGNRKRKHPYLSETFYQNPANQFWEDAHHTERAKEYFRNANNITG